MLVVLIAHSYAQKKSVQREFCLWQTSVYPKAKIARENSGRQPNGTVVRNISEAKLSGSTVNFLGYRRVDSRSTSFGEIRIFLGRAERFSMIRSIRSSAARAPISQVP